MRRDQLLYRIGKGRGTMGIREGRGAIIGIGVMIIPEETAPGETTTGSEREVEVRVEIETGMIAGERMIGIVTATATGIEIGTGGVIDPFKQRVSVLWQLYIPSSRLHVLLDLESCCTY
jgi:hypothetical protein